MTVPVVAEEAGAASSGARASARSATSADPRVSRPGSKAAGQRQAVEDIKAKRKQQPAPPADDPVEDDGPAAQIAPVKGLAKEGLQNAIPGSRFAGRAASAAVSSKAAQTGGGFVLGTVLYAYGLTYLRGGLPAVRALTVAKLFNKTQ